MFVIIPPHPNAVFADKKLWSVGVQVPTPLDHHFTISILRKFENEELAACYVHYLNGGDSTPFSEWEVRNAL